MIKTYSMAVFHQCVDTFSVLFVSIVLGGLVGFTMDRLSYHEDITFIPEVNRSRVLITGASSGLGEQLAYEYSTHGAALFITARSRQKLERVSEKCLSLGAAQVDFIESDLVRTVDAEKVAKLAVRTLGGLDQIIMAHEYSPSLHHWGESSSSLFDVQIVFDINVKSYIYLATHALPELKRSNGSIGIINSIAAKTYAPYTSLFTMSKHAIDGFFSTLRLELEDRKQNVSITNFVLGDIDTPGKRIELENAERDHDLDLTKSYSRLAPLSKAAKMVLQGMARRESEVYYPSSQDVKLRTLLRDWLPKTAHVSLSKPGIMYH